MGKTEKKTTTKLYAFSLCTFLFVNSIYLSGLLYNELSVWQPSFTEVFGAKFDRVSTPWSVISNFLHDMQHGEYKKYLSKKAVLTSWNSSSSSSADSTSLNLSRFSKRLFSAAIFFSSFRSFFSSSWRMLSSNLKVFREIEQQETYTSKKKRWH